MHRISTDADYLKTGKIIIDADGIPVDVPDRTHMEAADQALGQRLATIENRAQVTWLYYGTGTPTLGDFPGIKIGDRIMRVSDDQAWRVDE